MANDVFHAYLKFELGVVGIVGKIMIQATCNLEGNKYCSLLVYNTIIEYSDWLNENYDNLTFPGMSNVVDDCVTTLLGDNVLYEGMGKDALTEHIREKAKLSVHGGVKYFNDTIMGKLRDDLEIYKTCRYANPIWMRDNFQVPNFADIFRVAVTKLNRFHNPQIESMVHELINYKREVSDFRRTDDEGVYNVQLDRCAIFWMDRFARLPNLATFARYCFTLAPSSAAAERVFSILKNSFSVSQMRRSLEDYTECSVMLQHNKIEETLVVE